MTSIGAVRFSAWLVAAGALAGCGRLETTSEDGSADSVSGDLGGAHDSSSLDGGSDSGSCPIAPPAVGPSDCPLGLECHYYDACLKGGGGERYVCAWPFEKPKQWVRVEVDCSGVVGPDGCPVVPPLVLTSCKKTGLSCKYKACSRYVCTPDDAGTAIWTIDRDGCDAG